MMRCLLVLLGILVASAVATAQPVQPLHGEEIAAIWKERQDKVKTATFEYTRTHFQPKGALTRRNPLLISLWKRTYPDIDAKPIPEKDTKLQSPSRFLLDGLKIRHDYRSEQFHFTNREYYLKKEETAFDGKHFRSINSTQNGGDEGSVTRASRYQHPSLVGIQALVLSLRGRTQNISIIPDVRTASATGRRMRIDGVECLEYLIDKNADGTLVRKAWIAPSQDWQVLRLIASVPRNESQDKHELRYRSDPVVGWVPANWEYTRIEQGETSLQLNFSVDSYSINSSIDPTELVLKFPQGMTVLDESAKGGAVVGTVESNGQIVPDDGRQAYFLPGNEPSFWFKHSRHGLYALIAITAAALCWRLTKTIRKAAPIVPPPSQPQGEVS